MSAILIALLALVAIAIAVYPLFKTTQRVQATTELDPKLENLVSQREATYSALKDLELDHAQGKLGDADYATLRAKYETKALGILQQLQEFGKPIVGADAQRLHLSNNSCAQCGEQLASNDKFCRSCGAPLGARCLACGSAIASEDKFCMHCGTVKTISLVTV